MMGYQNMDIKRLFWNSLCSIWGVKINFYLRFDSDCSGTFLYLLHYFNENKERLTEIWWICDGRSICQNDEHHGNVKSGTSTHLPPVVSSKIIWVHFKFLLKTKENKNKMEMAIDDKKKLLHGSMKSLVIKTQTMLVMK